MDRKKWLSVAMALALAAPGAFAAETERDAHHPGTTPPAATTLAGMPMSGMSGNTSSMPMMDMMQMMMGQNGMAGHVEGRIAFLKAELKITDTQQPLWNTVADAMRASAKSMPGIANGMPMMGSAAATLPERLAAHETMMAAHLDGLRKFKAAVEPLYAALAPDQKKTADTLMIGPMGMGMGMGMM
jgi:hypothetical protein